MNRETYDALVASVEKWRRNANVLNKLNARIYAEDCPLCVLLTEKAGDEPDCERCPVMQATGYPNCIGSPWFAACDAYHGDTLKAFRKAAQVEADFLAALIPAGGPEDAP
jgi:hypothetical protein